MRDVNSWPEQAAFPSPLPDYCWKNIKLTNGHYFNDHFKVVEIIA
jgi:hypothetical protein